MTEACVPSVFQHERRELGEKIKIKFVRENEGVDEICQIFFESADGFSRIHCFYPREKNANSATIRYFPP